MLVLILYSPVVPMFCVSQQKRSPQTTQTKVGNFETAMNLLDIKSKSWCSDKDKILVLVKLLNSSILD